MFKKYNLLLIFFLSFIGLTSWAREKQHPKSSVQFLADGKILIHQPIKPGLPGKEGFKTKAAADKVAKLFIIKIKNAEMLPCVTVEELKKLNAL